MPSPCTAFPRPSRSMHFGDVAEVDLKQRVFLRFQVRTVKQTVWSEVENGERRQTDFEKKPTVLQSIAEANGKTT